MKLKIKFDGKIKNNKVEALKLLNKFAKSKGLKP